MAILKDNSLATAFDYMFSNELRRNKPIRMTVCGQEIFIRSTTPDLAVAKSSLGGEFSSLADAYSKSQAGLIIDAGAYIGTATIALSRMYPEATIVAIEPSSTNCRILRDNVSALPRIYIENAALVDHPTDLPVRLGNRGSGEWGFTIVEAPEDRPVEFLEEVPAISMEQILEKYGFDSAMIVKMDIEGAELELFSEHCDWLSRTDILFVELHERIASGINEAFRKANAQRFVSKGAGEKYLSVGQTYFSRRRS